MKSKGTVFKLLIVFAVIGFSIFYGFWILKPTSVTKDPDKADAYEQTMEHLNHIAAEIHPSGSEAIKEVREYLTEQFEQMDVSYEEFEFSTLMKKFKNYLVKIDAPDTDNGIMFVSHYDSTSRGPGAGDDGIAVASMLTVIGEVAERQEYTNDMYFLFTDGEELNLLGAADFLNTRNDTYKDLIKFVINVEARGNAGPLLMFETSDNNYSMVKMLKRAAKSGSTPFSFAAAVYKQMPNDTDFTEFLQRDYAGMNFAVVGGGENYHSKFDTVENLDKDTAYMYYSTISDLADYLESYDTDQLSASEDGVYFPVVKGRFVLFHESFMNAFSVITMLLFIAVLILSVRRRQVQGRKVVASGVVFITMNGIAFGIAFLLNVIGRLVFLNTKRDYQTLVGIRETIYVIQLGIMVLLVILLFQVLRKLLGSLADHLCLYGTLFFLLSGAIFIYFRPITYLFSIVLFLITLLLAANLFNEKKGKTVRLIIAIVLCLVVGILFLPMVIIVYQGLLLSYEINITGTVFGVVEVLLLSLCVGAVMRVQEFKENQNESIE